MNLYSVFCIFYRPHFKIRLINLSSMLLVLLLIAGCDENNYIIEGGGSSENAPSGITIDTTPPSYSVRAQGFNGSE